MDLDFSKVLSQLQLLLRAEVLVSEEDYTTLGDEQCQFILLFVVEIFELQADDLRTDVGGEVYDLLGGIEEGLFVRVCSGSRIDVFAIVVSDGEDVL